MKPLVDNDTFCYTIPIGWYCYPDWNPSLNEDTNRPQEWNHWLTMTPSAILSRLGDTVILIETPLSMRIPIDPNSETIGWQWHLLLYSPDWVILLSWLKPLSQWGYQQAPIRKPLIDNDTFCYTILIRWYFILIETPLSMRIPTGPNQETIDWQWHLLLYYPD